MFQCFHEAQEESLCEALVKSMISFRKGIEEGISLSLDYQTLFPHQVMSLGLFLSKTANMKWKKLCLHNCQISDHGIHVLHHYICGGTIRKYEIEIIDLSGNSLTEASSPLIGDIITHLHPCCLKLGWNKLTDLYHISNAIKSTATIKDLDLKDNGITIQDIHALSSMILYLEKLDISNNKLADYGAVLLSKAIAETCTLKTLIFNNNGTSDFGGFTMLTALSNNISLEKLEIDDAGLHIYNAIAERLHISAKRKTGKPTIYTYKSKSDIHQ